MVIFSVRHKVVAGIIAVWDHRPPSALEAALGLSPEQLRSFRRDMRRYRPSRQETQNQVDGLVELLGGGRITDEELEEKKGQAERLAVRAAEWLRDHRGTLEGEGIDDPPTPIDELFGLSPEEIRSSRKRMAEILKRVP